MYTRFIKALCPNPLERGEYMLDHNAAYGGYMITKKKTSGGESCPYGFTRRSAGEMYLSLLMAANVLEELDRGAAPWMPIADEGQACDTN